ncbi:MAG: Outer rane cobalamin receptor protein [Bacteroidetes bacterium]|nr:Outer rane cobalamin receptor protein [Bacteroidota bacterium]
MYMEKSLRLRSFEHCYLLVLIGLFASLSAFAQQITVKGFVKDVAGEPIIGASVVQTKSTNGTITSLEGDFTLLVPANATITVSFIGYSTQIISIDGKKSIVVVLKEDAKVLDEVVVVGYGTMKKSDLTGAVSSVGQKDLKDAPVANLGQAIQGKVSGVQIIDAGKPGDNVTIKIRGLGTINNSDPLVVIDGIPTDLGLASLNMANIERLDVLKDASATAIYGSRGANGVVMITSKRGQEGAGKVSVTANWAVQNATSVPNMLNASQYAALSNEMLTNGGRNTNPDWADPTTLGAGTDWLDELLHAGVMQNYSVSYSGGSDKAHYYVSGGFLNQSGTVRSVNYRRFNFQANSDAEVKKWLKFTTNLAFSTDVKEAGAYNIGDAMKALPTQTLKNEDGTWSGPVGNSEWFGSIRNPIGTTYLMDNETKGYNLLANITGELSFTKWLKLKSTFGYDAKFWFEDNFTPAYDWEPSPIEESSRYKKDSKAFTYLWDNYFVFDRTFAEKHHLELMAGSSAQWNETDNMSAQVNGFMFDNVKEMSNGEEMFSIGGTSSEWSLLSFMGRLNYSYNNRYLLTATIRRDGSSRFGKNNRWGTFPSVSAAWRMSEEEWFPKENLFINDLKVRAGYGVTGNQEIGNYGYVATYNTGVYPFGTTSTDATALVSTTLSNPNIHWEEVAQANIGADLALFNLRVNLSLDAYMKNTSDMLVKASIPITSGYEDTTTTYTNAGKVRNKGFEASLRTLNLQGPLSWETIITATYNKNEIRDLNSETPMYTNQYNNSYLTMLKAGYPINVFYGYVTDGIFQNADEVAKHSTQVGAEAGDIRFRDLNNDGVISDNDRTVIGNPNPNWFFSMNNRLTYKGFELSVFLQGVSGNDIYNVNNIDNEGMGSAYNQTTATLNRWTGEGTSNSMPRAVWADPNQNCRVSNRFVEDGSYLRIKNITLGYTLPKQWLEKIQLDNARVYFSCENVATITGYSGFDPEVDVNGIDSNRYPISRTYSVGVNFNF